MNTNPSPLQPQGSLQSQGKKGLTLPRAAVFIFAIHLVVFSILLIEGCNKNKDTGANSADAAASNNAAATTSALPPYSGSNTSAYSAITAPTNPVAYAAPTNNAPTPLTSPSPIDNSPARSTTTTPVDTTVPRDTTVAGDMKEYTVVKGDTLGKIAKKNGVKLSALKKANPGVVPEKLKTGQKIKIPASSGGVTTVADNGSGPVTKPADDGASYEVKTGDTLHKIAKAHGTTAKKIKTLNNLPTDRIRVGQKLKLPPPGAAGADEKSGAPKADSTGDAMASNSAPNPSNASSTNH